MNHFANALAGNYTQKIPREDDWFAPMIGDWKVSCYSRSGSDPWQRRGQWLFRRILDGTGVEDLFQCEAMEPPRSAAMRLYNEKERCYTAVCTRGQEIVRLRFEKEGSRLIGTNLDKPDELHVFSDIREDSFTWNRMIRSESGAWREEYTIYATRIRG